MEPEPKLEGGSGSVSGLTQNQVKNPQAIKNLNIIYVENQTTKNEVKSYAYLIPYLRELVALTLSGVIVALHLSRRRSCIHLI